MIRGLTACVLAAERASRWVTASRTLTTASALTTPAEDPFQLVVPPLVGADQSDIDGPTLEALAGLYLMAQLEQAGVLVAAELFVTHRASLDITSTDTAERLEDAAVAAREWIPVQDREHLYSRVFGTPAPDPAAESLANREFPQLLADLCSAIEAFDASRSLYLPAPSQLRSGVGRAVSRLRGNLAFRQYGSTLLAARRIAGQVRETVELLSDPGLIQLARGHTMWDVVRATWDPDDQPDIERLVTMGQAGQVVIGWTGAPDALTATAPATVRDAAAQWLLQAGVTAQAGMTAQEVA